MMPTPMVLPSPSRRMVNKSNTSTGTSASTSTSTFWHGFCWYFIIVVVIGSAAANASPPYNDKASPFKNHLADRVKTKGRLRNRFFALRHGQSEANVAKVIASNPAKAKHKYGLSDTGRKQAELAGKQLVADFLKARGEQKKSSNLFKKLFKKLFRTDKSKSRSSLSHFPPPKGIVIVCSDLKRACETASLVFNAVLEHNEALTEDRQDEAIPLYSPVDDDYNGDGDGNDGKINLQLTESEDTGIARFTKLRERWFGEWDGKSDVHYQDVWKDDLVDPYHTNKGVESVWSVLNRATQLVCALDDMETEDCTKNDNGVSDECMWIICVAHGDVLQILQTAFSEKLDPSKHRSLEHLETATLRPFQ